MSKCPFRWEVGQAHAHSSGEAEHLRVMVRRNMVKTVDVSLPADSARRLISLIPDDVLARIREEKIPIDEIEADLKSRDRLVPQALFKLAETNRDVLVWLE